MSSIIKAENLTKIYKLLAEEIGAVKGINLSIEEGEFVSVLGPSGSGKTTLLDMIGCLDSITSGALNILGQNVSSKKESQLVALRQKNIGFVFQDFSLIPSLTALENVKLPLYFCGISKDNKQAEELLERVGLGHRINHLPKQMSGGEKQRVAIARALITMPKLLLADEPTGHLDSKNASAIFELFQKLNTEYNLTIVVTTHNKKLGSYARRSIYLKDGKVVTKDESSLFDNE